MVKCPYAGMTAIEVRCGGWPRAGGRGDPCPPLSSSGIGHGHLAVAHDDSAASSGGQAHHRRLGEACHPAADDGRSTRAATPRRRPCTPAGRHGDRETTFA